MLTNFDPEKEAHQIELCKKDVRHFSNIYEANVDRLYSYCLLRCNRNEERAMDIVSDTFTKAIENIEKYNYTGRPFIAWLYTIAHNLIIDQYKQKQTLSIDELELEPKDETEEQIDKLADQELKDIIKEMIKELPDDIQDLLILRNDQDLSFSQIADLKGEKEGAIKMRYYRVVEYLKQKLSKDKPDLMKYMNVILMFIVI
ncbi:MAG: RNA polymerase sigma factor [bacterium]